MSRLITPPFRISFPALFTPTGYQGSEPKYGVTAIWVRDDVVKNGRYNESWNAVVAALDEQAREFFKSPLGKLAANIKRGIRNGNEKEHLNGYGDGTLFANLRSARKPQIVDLRKQIIPDGDTGRIYPGAWARASVHAYAYDNIGKGVALGLDNLQWLGHGERLDSVTDAREDFDADPDDEWFSQETEDDIEDGPGDHGASTAGAAPPDDDDEIPF